MTLRLPISLHWSASAGERTPRNNVSKGGAVTQQTDAAIALERHSIDHIPTEERHGKPWPLFTLWFPSNLQINALVTGAVAVLIGLSLPWAIFAIVLGNLVGALFMAYHSVQGPRLGVP